MSNNELIDLGIYAKDAYLKYAMHVVTDRALPFVQDGLKPVHRRILYAMQDLSNDWDKPRKKSARIVGDVIGKYHPHGDSAVYEAMVGMAQGFNIRYPLIDGQGNWGDRDEPKSFAAMRYTEARMSKIATCLLDELSWDTVDYKLNFDGSLSEPALLPSRLPFLLLNGSYGIGVGMATNFPSHHIGEVVEAAKLIFKKPKSTLKEVMEIIKGPDYPTGGQIISSPEEIYKAYEQGRGAVRMRAKWNIVPKGKDWAISIYELPYDVSVGLIISQIAALVDPQPKLDKSGKKKPLTAKQTQLKRIFGEMISSVKDLSVDGVMSLTITPKNRKQDPEELIMSLLAHTSLEVNQNLNFVVVDDTGRPTNKNILAWLTEWCNFRVETIRRRTTDKLNKTNARLHILNGRLSILDKIDKVIKVLKESDNPKQDLMAKFKLDEIQAEDILDMRLRSLAKLAKISIEEEHAKLTKLKAELEDLLSSDANIKKLAIKELDADLKAFGDERKTLVEAATSSSAKDITDNMVQDKASNEPIAVALTEKGWLSWKSAKQLGVVQDSDFKIKTGDKIRRVFIGTRADTLMLLDQNGRGYSLNLIDLSGRNGEQSIIAFFKTGAKMIEGAISSSPEDRYILAGENGYGFVIKADKWINRQKAGKDVLTLAPNECPVEPVAIPSEATPDSVVVLLTSDNKNVALPLGDIKELGKGKGVALLGLAPDQRLLDIALTDADGKVTLKDENGTTADLSAKDIKKVLGARKSTAKGKVINKNQNWIKFEKTPKMSIIDGDNASDDSDNDENSEKS